MVMSEPSSTGINKVSVIKVWDQVAVIYTSLSPLCHHSFPVVMLVLGLNEQRTILSPQKTKTTSIYFLDVFQQVLEFSVWITTKQRLRKATSNERSSKHLTEIWFFALVLLLVVALRNRSMPLCLLLDKPTSKHFHKMSISLVRLI